MTLRNSKAGAKRSEIHIQRMPRNETIVTFVATVHSLSVYLCQGPLTQSLLTVRGDAIRGACEVSSCIKFAMCARRASIEQ